MISGVVKATCIKEGCGNHRIARGLCYDHYFHAKKMMRSGGASWEQLESTGEALPPKTCKGRGLPPQQCIVTVRVSRAARERLNQRARQAGMSLNEMCLRLLGEDKP